MHKAATHNEELPSPKVNSAPLRNAVLKQQSETIRIGPQ